MSFNPSFAALTERLCERDNPLRTLGSDGADALSYLLL
jgi:hypothetical protein